MPARIPVNKTENPRMRTTFRLRTAPAMMNRHGMLTAGRVMSTTAAIPVSPLFINPTASGISVHVGTMSKVANIAVMATPNMLFPESGIACTM